MRNLLAACAALLLRAGHTLQTDAAGAPVECLNTGYNDYVRKSIAAMPRLRINVRTLTEDEELDLIDNVTELTEREERNTQDKSRATKRPISAINL